MRYRQLILLTLIFAFPKFSSADHIILSHRMIKAPDVEVKVAYLSETPYMSLNDLARAYKIRTYYRKESFKIVLYFSNMQIKASAGSSFLMFGSQMRHLSDVAIHADNEVFVPVFPFINLFEEMISPGLNFSIIEASTKYVFKDPFTGEIIPESATKGVSLRLKGEKINLTEIQYEEKENGLAVEIATTQPFKDSDFASFFRGGNWFYLTIYGGKCDSVTLSAIDPTTSVRKVEAISRANSVQISFQLNRKFTSSDVHYDNRTGKILLSLFFPLNKDIKKKIEDAKTAWIIDTVVLDPGHGGKDPGTPRRWGSMHEKDIVLDIALRLGKLLEDRTDLKVVYTRKTDIFIPLWKRTEIANKSGGKLFLSIHVNAHKSKSANGIEFYLLRPGKSEDAIKVAERENSVIQLEGSEDKLKYHGYDDISNILANMVYSVNLKDSEKLAEIMSKNVSVMVPQKNRGVRQAAFYVLVGASMPNVFCELGYITNKAEARKLNSKRHRQLIAEALYKSVIGFKGISDQSVVKKP